MSESKDTLVNVTSLDALAERGLKDVAVAIGVFDGVHLGHQALLNALKTLCDEVDAIPVALTFYPHPRNVLRPNSPQRLIASPEKKIELLHHYGARAVVTIPFTRAFADLTPDQFIRECLLAARIRLKGICVGEDWRFGRGGAGSIDELKRFADDGHFRFVGLKEVRIGDKQVSSTAIRRAIGAGRLGEAEAMLGRRFSLRGVVGHGKRVAGTRLTYPTANVDPKNEVIPPNGVYAGIVVHQKRRHQAAVAVGVAPTYHRLDGGAPRRVEAHLLDFHGDLYGKTIDVEFIEHIREERCFSSEDELRERIKRDIEEVRGVFKNSSSEGGDS